MARLNPGESQEALKDRVLTAISDNFPYEGKKHTLRLKTLELRNEKDTHDVREQKVAKLGGRTFGSDVVGTLELVDNDTGKVVETSRRKLATLPQITRRYSYLIDGSEYQVENLWTLKPGIYTRIAQNGEFQSHINTKGISPRMKFDPESRKFSVKIGDASPPLYPIMRALGVPDSSLEKAWGSEIYQANKFKEQQVEKKAIDFAKRLRPKAAINTFEDASQVIRERFKGAELDPQVTEQTLGRPIKKLTPEAITLASSHLLSVARGERKPDDRDSLMFKDLNGVEDFVYNRFQENKRVIDRKVRNNLDRQDVKIGRIIGPDLFNQPIRSFFAQSTLANTTEQTNPVAMLSNHQKTTILGSEGGIKSAQTLTPEAKLLNPSHFGFLDPLNTPECFDSETEVFTRRGWVPWPEVVDDEEFACCVDGRLEFHKASRVVREHYQGVMYGAETRYFSYLVTPNHRMWCRSRDLRSPEMAKWHFESAEEMHSKTRNVNTIHEPYCGEEVEFFQLPHVRGNNSSKNFDRVPMSAWAAFMGWYLSEGSYAYNEKDSRYFVRITQNEKANPENCREIAWVLDQLPFKWTYTDGDFVIGVKQLARYVTQFGKAKEKVLPEYLLEAGVEAREALLTALLLGDGRLNYRRTNGDLFHDIDCFTTTSPKLAEGVERLVISLGYASTHQIYEDKREERYLDVHEVRILRRRERVVRKGIDHTETQYDGLVYCATVPGGLLYTRRNRKAPFWSGNSEKTGLALNLALGARKEGRDVKIPLYNTRTGKLEHVTPAQAVKSTVAMADEVKWQNGKPVPKQDRVKASMKGGEFGVVPFRDVEYVVRSPGQIMSLPMNLVPFLANDSQNRSTMAGRHQEQAVSLKHREAPLVQAAAGKQTFDEVFGGFTAQSSPVSGTVEKVKKDSIVIRDKDGKLRDVPIYDNYPLTEKKGMLHSEPTVKVGQKVKRGQLIADTSFTKNGVYAPGTNLKVAYLPAKGLNVEDGIVISQSAAKKLTSEHLHKKNLSTQVAEVAPVKRFTAYLPERINVTQQAKLGKDGVIKVGQTVEPGDVLVTALRENRITPDDADFGRLHKSMAKPYADSSVVWEENHRGKVVGVHKRPKGIEVHVRTEEPAIVGDKIVSRHANKGVITAILPDNQMPKTGDGKGIDVLHNPIGVPGRMNVGQILETAASKIAEKTGKPFVTQNFEETDARTRIEKELKKHGLTDKETLTDQETGRKIPGVLVGNQYTLKLHHQVEDKLSVRSRGSYDRNLAPKGGGSAGGQSIGALETYGLLAHGAVKNIRDFSTYRADRGQGGDNDELWTALQAGEALPPPRPTFAYKKFEAMLRTMGVNVEKDGNSLNLLPMTDKDILAMSSGEIKDGGLMLKWDRKQKELIPEAKGLFDPKVTGGQSGTKWGHITLRERMPNPVFEKAIVSLTGLTKPEFTKIINGKKGVTKDGEIVDPGDSRATYGPSAVGHLLGKVDPKKEIKQLEESLPTLKEGKLDKANKRLKYLKALEKAGMSPNEAYMTKYVPVLPPVMRPISVMADGKLQYETVNHLYKHLALDNQKLGMINANKYLPDEESLPLRAKVYDHLKSVSGLGGSLNKEYPGLLDVIAGESPKEGYFQKKLVKKRQDLSLRSTIVPEPSLSLDEVGIPRKAAVELYKPFVAQQLRHHFGMTPLEAKLAIKENREVVNKALEQVVEERPLLLKRDPVLHKYGIQAFKPKLMEGNAIRIHPMVTSGFNADFDGDAMSAYVPMTNEAVDEARKMMPSNMLFSPSSAKVAYTPIKEMQVGLYGLTEVGKKTGKSFKSRKELEAAVNAGTVDATDIVQVQGKETTLGRMQLLDALPESLKQRSKFEDLKYRFDKKEQSKFFNAIARADPKTYPDVIDKLKNLGNEHVYFSGMSIGLDDLKTHKDIRDPILKAAAQKTKHLDLSKPEDTAKFLKVYDRAITDLDKGTKDRALKGKTQLDRLEIAAGIKGDGYRQLTAAPVLFKDPLGNIVTVPVEKSYAEGLSTADYWASINGGRKGIVQKVQSVRVPGHISKNLTNTTMNQIVQATDCGTTRGVSVGLDDPDVIGRYTQRPIKLSDGRTLSTGTLITPETLVELRKAKVQKPVVRSPMRCSHPDGVCSKCYGLDQDGRLPDKGTNLGVIAAQSLGERNVQLSMREFHSGGVHQPGKQSLADQGIERVSQIFQMPTKLKGSAVLAKVNGTVSEVQKDPAGGWNVVVEGKRHYIPASRKLSIKLGDKVKKGVPLSSGPVNPHELLPLTNINKVQNYLADELDGIYRPEGIRRRNTELVVRSMTNLTQVRDPGSHPEFIRGDFATTAAVDHLNRTQLKGQRQIRHEPVVKGIGRMPLDMQEDWLARLNHERLKETVIEGAQRGWSSDLHGTHPVPGIVYGAEFGSGTGAAKY